MEQFIKHMEQFIKHFQNSDKSSRNISSKKWNISLKPSKKVDESWKQSSLEEDSVTIIGTRPQISCYVSPIGQNVVIPNRNSRSKKWQIRFDKRVDNAIPGIIDHNLRYRNTVNSIILIEEFNMLLLKTILMGTKR